MIARPHISGMYPCMGSRGQTRKKKIDDFFVRLERINQSRDVQNERHIIPCYRPLLKSQARKYISGNKCR